MDIKQIIRGRSYKTVTISDVLDSDTEDEIKALALKAADETVASTFGTSTTRYSDLNRAVVEIWID